MTKKEYNADFNRLINKKLHAACITHFNETALVSSINSERKIDDELKMLKIVFYAVNGYFPDEVR
jgi:hypothetical protein